MSSVKLLNVALLTISLGLISCTRDVGDSNITIELPGNASLSKVSSQSVTKLSTPFAKGSETSWDNVNCYMLVVQGPEEFLNRNHCEDSNGAKHSFGYFVAGIPATGLNQEITLDVPSGSDREILLFGINADAGYCTNLGVDQTVLNNWTKPRYISSTGKIDLKGGEQEAKLTVPVAGSSIATKLEIEKCQIEGRQHESQPNNSAGMFGDGSAGDLSLPGSAYDLSTNTDQNGQFFTAYKRVTHISADGKTLTTRNPVTGMEIATGNEIMWVVNAEKLPSSSCGGGLIAGMRGTAKVVSVAGSNVVLDSPIGNGTGTYNLAALAENSVSSASQFCRIQILRIPHLNNIIVNANSTLNTIPYQFDDTGNGQGGIIAFRVKGSIQLGPNNLIIDASVQGFPGQLGQGSGITGLGNTGSAANNANGGGADQSGNGGGGGAGAVGDGGDQTGNSGGTKGIAPTCGGPCSAVGGQPRLHFGGAGGGLSGSNAGGTGGGIVFLHVKRVDSDAAGSEYLKLEANGAIGATNAGGGGGGLVHLTVDVFDADFHGLVKGGDGGATNGAPGGGGLIEVKYCNVTGATNAIVTSGSGAVGATNGANLSSYEPGLCGAL